MANVIDGLTFREQAELVKIAAETKHAKLRDVTVGMMQRYQAAQDEMDEVVEEVVEVVTDTPSWMK